MTDYELHREEFIRERSGMILADCPWLETDEADARAEAIWNAMQELAKSIEDSTGPRK